MTTLDEVIETVRGAREDGPDALAAMALSYGATMVLGSVRIAVLRGQLAAAAEAADAPDLDYPAREALWKMRDERDAAEGRLRKHQDTEMRYGELVNRHNRLCTALATALPGTPPNDGAITAEWLIAQVQQLRVQLGEVCAARDSARIRAERAESEAAQLRAERDAAITRAERAESERDAAHVEISRSTTRQLNTMRDERDAARAEADRLRALPTYDARTTPPTAAEHRAHTSEGCAWLVSWTVRDDYDYEACEVRSGDDRLPTHGTYVPLGRDRRPCAWPVSAEGGA